MTVTFSSRALDDLCDIGDVIAAADNARAARFLARCLGSVRKPLDDAAALSPDPKAGETWNPPPIFYVVNDGDVMIVRVLHAARDYERLLFPGI